MNSIVIFFFQNKRRRFLNCESLNSIVVLFAQLKIYANYSIALLGAHTLLYIVVNKTYLMFCVQQMN